MSQGHNASKSTNSEQPTHTPTTQPTMMGVGGGMGMGGGPGRGMVMNKVRPANTPLTLKRLWGYLSAQRTGLILVIILTAVNALLGLVGPYLMGVAIDQYIIPRDYYGLMRLCILLLSIYIAGSIMTWFQASIMIRVAQFTIRDLRKDLFEKLQRLPLRFFDGKTHGELMSRATNDIDNISNTLSQSVTQIITSLITVVGALAIMLNLNIWLTLMSLITVPIITLITRKLAIYTRSSFSGQQKSMGAINGFIEETVSGHQVVKTFGREEEAITQFQGINEQLTRVGIKAQISSGILGPLMNVMNNLSFAIIAFGGGWMVLAGLTTIGIAVSFLNYSRMLGRPINDLANQYNMIQAGIAGAERVFEIMDTQTEYENTSLINPVNNIVGEVVFDHVTFGYKKEIPILKNISFVAKPGDTIALVGPTGAGKTTIVNLLTRFYDIDEGVITIDGTDIQKLDKDGLRRKLGIVLQDAYLFSDTVRENIRYGKPEATDLEVEAAAKMANADSFINHLTQGYDTILSVEGNNLSHGQRQLLTIARAILADPAILILDEATSGIDTRTEMHIQEAMATLMKGRTSFVIAHRLNTIRDADLILVIDGGEIVESGTHDQLLEHQGFYHKLYTSQFSNQIA